MSAGRKSLRRLQVGRENPAGTSQAATVRLRFQDATLEDALEIQETEEQIGVIGGVDRTALVKTAGKLSIGSQPITFEQFPYILAMSFGMETTATLPATTSADRVFSVNLPLTTAAVPVAYTFEGGDDHEVERMLYGYCNHFALSGKGGDVLKMAAEFGGRGPTTAAGWTTTAKLLPVENIVFSKGKVFLDAITGSFGATQITTQVIAFNLDAAINNVEKYTADGALNFSFVTYIDHVITGSLTFEHDTAASGSTGAKLDWRAQTPKLLRVQWQGTQITSNGGAVVTAGNTSYGFKTFQIDLPVKWTTIGKIEDDAGNDLITANFRSRYDLANSTAGAGAIRVVLDTRGCTTGALTLP